MSHIVARARWSSGSLLTLIANRIRHSLPALAENNEQTCWEALFAATPGGGSFPYMIDRTLYRPREIIQFCVHALE